MPVYRLLISLFAPLLIAGLALRVLRGRETARDLAQRMGRVPPAPSGATLWLHGASNGELTAAHPLIMALLARHPGLSLLITCNSITGRALVKAWGSKRITPALAPLDLRRWTVSILRAWKPRTLIVIENELWPNRLAAAQAANIPVALVGARMSERSAALWRRLPGARSVLTRLALLAAQDGASEARFLALGVPQPARAKRIALKSLYVPVRAGAHASRRASTWLAASTHEGEEEKVLDAHLIAREQWPELRLILAPRHPARADRIAALIAGRSLTLARRSEGADGDSGADVLLADSLGEMALWYDAASYCFVGGSLVPKGGHTPYEPAAHGCAILFGPDTTNFPDPCSRLLAMGGARQVRTAQELASALLALKDPEVAAAQIAAANSALAEDTDLEALLCRLDALIGEATKCAQP